LQDTRAFTLARVHQTNQSHHLALVIKLPYGKISRRAHFRVSLRHPLSGLIRTLRTQQLATTETNKL